jgi:hypothetical protein
MRLTGEHINTVIDWINSWINSEAWAESAGYLHDHASQLLTDTTVIVLDELALTAPEDVITQHRILLDEIRARGLDAAYRVLLLTDTLREWIATSSWEASRAFLHDHPELLGEDAASILPSLNGDSDSEIVVHEVLLTLAKAAGGVDGAYSSLQDEHTMQAAVTTLRPSKAAQIVVMKIPTAENPRMTGRAAPAATPGIRPAWASPNEVEPAMKQGRPSAVGSPSGESSAARGSVSAALASSEDVPVLIVTPSCAQDLLTAVLSGLTELVMNVKLAEWSGNGIAALYHRRTNPRYSAVAGLLHTYTAPELCVPPVNCGLAG